jgi:hypothetical protein
VCCIFTSRCLVTALRFRWLSPTLLQLRSWTDSQLRNAQLTIESLRILGTDRVEKTSPNSSSIVPSRGCCSGRVGKPFLCCCLQRHYLETGLHATVLTHVQRLGFGSQALVTMFCNERNGTRGFLAEFLWFPAANHHVIFDQHAVRSVTLPWLGASTEPRHLGNHTARQFLHFSRSTGDETSVTLSGRLVSGSYSSDKRLGWVWSHSEWTAKR